MNDNDKAAANGPAEDDEQHCAFCGRGPEEVQALVRGPQGTICDRCVAEFRERLARGQDRD